MFKINIFHIAISSVIITLLLSYFVKQEYLENLYPEYEDYSIDITVNSAVSQNIRILDNITSYSFKNINNLINTLEYKYILDKKNNTIMPEDYGLTFSKNQFWDIGLIKIIKSEIYSFFINKLYEKNHDLSEIEMDSLRLDNLSQFTFNIDLKNENITEKNKINYILYNELDKYLKQRMTKIFDYNLITINKILDDTIENLKLRNSIFEESQFQMSIEDIKKITNLKELCITQISEQLNLLKNETNLFQIYVRSYELHENKFKNLKFIFLAVIFIIPFFIFFIFKSNILFLHITSSKK